MAEQKSAGGYTYTDHNAGAADVIKNDKLAALKAIAQHGSQGKEIYEQQRQAELARRNKAVQDAASATLGSPSSLAAELAAKRDALNTGLDQALDSGQAQTNSEFDSLASAEGRYLDQAAGAAALNTQALNQDLVAAGAERDAAAAARRSSSGGGSSSYSSGDDSFSYDGAADWTPGDGSVLRLPDTDPEGDGWAYSGEAKNGGDPNYYTITLRKQMDDLIRGGGDSTAAGDALVDFLDASPLPESQKARIMATMDNHYGITPEGQQGAATPGMYFDPTPKVATQQEINEVWRQGAQPKAEPKKKKVVKKTTRSSGPITKKATPVKKRESIQASESYGPPAPKRTKPIKINESTYKDMVKSGVLRRPEIKGMSGSFLSSMRLPSVYTVEEWDKLDPEIQAEIVKAHKTYKSQKANRGRNMR